MFHTCPSKAVLEASQKQFATDMKGLATVKLKIQIGQQSCAQAIAWSAVMLQVAADASWLLSCSADDACSTSCPHTLPLHMGKITSTQAAVSLCFHISAQ